MKIIKPLKLSLLTKTYRYRRGDWLAVSPICFFRLGTDEIITEAQGWKSVMAVPGMENGFDMAMPKKYGEFLAMGNAYAQEGEGILQMETRICLGRVERSLTILGNRDPETNLMHILGVVGSGKSFTPPGFGMIDITSGLRQKKSGTYDDNWLENAYPGFPDDIDWTVFNAAPETQWDKGFFNGDEGYEIKGMHPRHPTLSGCLPKIRTRVFIRQEEENRENFREIATGLDTVWFFPEIETGILIFRGRAGIKDSDALDIQSLLVAYENIGDEKRSAAYYRDIHDKRTDVKQAAAHVFNESQLSPEKSGAQKALEAREKKRAEQKALENKQKAVEAAVAAFTETTGMALPDTFEMPAAVPDAVGIIPEKALERGDFDLSEIIEKARKEADKHMKEGRDKFKAAESKEKSLLAHFPAEPSLPPEAKMSQLKETAYRNALNQADDQQRMIRQYSPKPLFPGESLPREVKIYLRDLVALSVKNGETLKARDFAGADLSNMDFSGMDMTGVMLEKTDLSGARFVGTDLTDAVLNAATLDQADFSGAVLKGANLCNARGRETVFTGCDFTAAFLDKACFEKAGFSKAVFNQVNGVNLELTGSTCPACSFSGSLFIDARLEKTVFDGSGFERCIITNSQAEFSSFRDAKLTRCALVNIEADGTDFSGASMKTVQFAGDCLVRSADFSRVDARECGFRQADFSDTCLNDSAFLKSDLGNVSFRRAAMKNSAFCKSVMMGACLENTVIEEGDFFEALLRKTDFSGARLSRINFSGAETGEAIWPDDCRETGGQP
ncbi:MAG: DUF2169 domain-containing protein [Desulfobacterales bacterium]|nr:DUF2169 domain-containing protein [Desulfobacterales bacterium]